MVTQFAASTTILAGVAVLAYLGVQIYQKKKRDIIPWKWEEVGTLIQLYFYPLKSGHRIELTRGDCTEYGIRQSKEDEKLLQLRDRCLVVYAERDNEFRTARTYPNMFLIDVAVHDESHLAVDAPTMRTLYVRVPQKGTDKEVTVTLHHGEKAQGLDCGDEAALWFSRYILQKDSGLRLCYNASDVGKRREGKQYKKVFYDYYKNFSSLSTGIFSDQVSVHIISQPSVKDLQKRISTDSITVHNFRANIVVDGPGLKPYDEDDWEWIKIGDVILRTTHDCTRCMIPTIDPDTGVKNSTGEPTKTLNNYRVSKGPFPLPVMGLQLEVRKTGPLKVGEKIFVARRKHFVFKALAGVVVLAYLGIQIYQKKKRDAIPLKWEEVGTLAELYFYPLKSGRRIELTRGDCTEYGIRQCKEDEKLLPLRDRCLVVYSERDNEFRTARTYPNMLLIDVTTHGESHLVIHAPTMNTLYVKVPQKGIDKEVTILLHYGEKVQGLDCGDKAALWFSRYMLQKDSGLRLCYNAADVGRRRQGKQMKKAFYKYYKNYSSLSTGIFSDEVSIHMVTQPSVKDLHQRVSTDNITVHNFRPNIVVDGPGLKPYDEDDWEWIKIGDVVLRTTHDTTRCIIPNMDPDTGIRNSSGEPATTLKKYRVSKGPFPLPVMGLDLEVRKTGPLKVGENILVVRRK